MNFQSLVKAVPIDLGCCLSCAVVGLTPTKPGCNKTRTEAGPMEAPGTLSQCAAAKLAVEFE